MSQFLEDSSLGDFDLDNMKQKREDDQDEESKEGDMIFAPSDDNKNHDNDLKSSSIMDFRFQEQYYS
jgi:hypothetical protein